jgi:hypothetical protein
MRIAFFSLAVRTRPKHLQLCYGYRISCVVFKRMGFSFGRMSQQLGLTLPSYIPTDHVLDFATCLGVVGFAMSQINTSVSITIFHTPYRMLYGRALPDMAITLRAKSFGTDAPIAPCSSVGCFTPRKVGKGAAQQAATALMIHWEKYSPRVWNQLQTAANQSGCA